MEARQPCGLSHHIDHDKVKEVMSSNPAITKNFLNLFNYLFDLFFSFSHLLVTRTSTFVDMDGADLSNSLQC